MQRFADKADRRAYAAQHDALSAMTHRERGALDESGCLGLMTLQLGPVSDEAKERLEAGFGQGRDLTHVEYASVCADILHTTPTIGSPVEHLAGWTERLRPPDSLKDFHEAKLDVYLELRKIVERGEWPGDHADSIRSRWEKIHEEFLALDAPTRELLRETGCY